MFKLLVVVDKPREKIEYNPLHIYPLQSTAIATGFHFNTPDVLHVDIVTSSYRRKQFRLLTIHEKLGHLSFSTLHLMDNSGMIPQNLVNIDPPTCPSCAYGKAHRKQLIHNGVNNLKHL